MENSDKPMENKYSVAFVFSKPNIEGLTEKDISFISTLHPSLLGVHPRNARLMEKYKSKSYTNGGILLFEALLYDEKKFQSYKTKVDRYLKEEYNVATNSSKRHRPVATTDSQDITSVSRATTRLRRRTTRTKHNADKMPRKIRSNKGSKVPHISVHSADKLHSNISRKTEKTAPTTSTIGGAPIKRGRGRPRKNSI